MFDAHVHTDMSTDSSMLLEEGIKRAGELGIGLIITDHMDTNYPGKEKFNFDPDSFFSRYGKYRSERLLLGIELGMTLGCSQENEAIIKNYPFDFVIGSVHFLGSKDIFYKEAYEGKTKREAFEEYLRTMYDNIKAHSYIDSLGHIDYISRYAVYEDKEIYYNEYAELIDEVLKAVIENNIAMEINTRRLGSKSAVESLRVIYKRYMELGGKYVTIGSDSHTAGSIGCNFKEAVNIVRDLSLQPVYFKERERYSLSV